jgi:hypothetical protein
MLDAVYRVSASCDLVRTSRATFKNLNALMLDVATMLYWVLDLRVMIHESTVRREKG